MYCKYLKSLGNLRGVDKPPFFVYTISINNKEREIIMEKIVKTFKMQDTSGKENQIRFVNAHKGGIQMYGQEPGDLVAWAKTPEMIAYALRTKGADDIINGGSSMDFASENGFANDEDAMTLWSEGYNQYIDEINAVGKWNKNFNNYGSAI
jgi:hypothetical protein